MIHVGFKENPFHPSGNQAGKEVAQRGCAVSFLGSFQDQTGQPALTSALLLSWADGWVKDLPGSLPVWIFLWSYDKGSLVFQVSPQGRPDLWTSCGLLIAIISKVRREHISSFCQWTDWYVCLSACLLLRLETVGGALLFTSMQCLYIKAISISGIAAKLLWLFWGGVILNWVG